MNTRYRENVNRLFEFWCELTPIYVKENTLAGQITSSFPKSFNDNEIILKIPDFVYPCPISNKCIQVYSFVLTSTDSKWRFGFCRHDPGCLEAMVLITYLPWHDIFIKFLNILGEMKKTNNKEFLSFLYEVYGQTVPEPGSGLKIYYNMGSSSFTFQRPSRFLLPSIPENHNLNLYYNFVDPQNMVEIFAAMLAERRIIFISHRLDKLSSCVQAASALLYPMVWQHVFIPILPLNMKEILSAPMPYLIGAPEPIIKTVPQEELGDAIKFNCDTNMFVSLFDDTKNMPPHLLAQLKKQLNNSQDHVGDRISKIFLGFIVQLIGGYRDAIKFVDEKIIWDKNTFIESRPTEIRNYLKSMTELQIFQQFIEERINMLNTGLGFSDEFELETLRYLEKSSKRNSQYAAIFKTLKCKVKQNSNGVKNAYKDIKTKLRMKGMSKSNDDKNVFNDTSEAHSSSFHNSLFFAKAYEQKSKSDSLDSESLTKKTDKNYKSDAELYSDYSSNLLSDFDDNVPFKKSDSIHCFGDIYQVFEEKLSSSSVLIDFGELKNSDDDFGNSEKYSADGQVGQANKSNFSEFLNSNATGMGMGTGTNDMKVRNDVKNDTKLSPTSLDEIELLRKYGLDNFTLNDK